MGAGLGLVGTVGTAAAVERTTWRRARSVSWPTGTPAEFGIDAGRLAELQLRLGARKTRAFLVARNGSLVHEWYRLSPRAILRHPSGRTWPIASSSKALLATTALLLCAGDGLIDLDVPVARYLRPWASRPLLERVTLRHLASHTSGLDEARNPAQTDEPLEAWERLYRAEPSSRVSLSVDVAPVRFSPGWGVLYSNPAYSIIAAVLAVALQPTPWRDARELLRARIMQPLGIPDDAWAMSYGRTYPWQGFPVLEFGGGAKLTGRAAARLAQLYLGGGVWNGRPLLDPTDLRRALATENAPLPADARETRHPRPMLGWWSNADRAWASVPHDTMVAAGARHQIIAVIPSLDLIAIRFGDTIGRSRFGGDFWATLEDEFLAPLMRCLG